MHGSHSLSVLEAAQETSFHAVVTFKINDQTYSKFMEMEKTTGGNYYSWRM